MRFQFIENKKTANCSLWSGIWLFAVIGALLSMVDSLAYIAAGLPGVLVVVACGFLPKKRQRIIGAAIIGLCLLWVCMRLAAIGDGLGTLANRLFTLSEEGQDFCYTHFIVERNAPGECLLFVSCALGALWLLLGNGILLPLTLLIAMMIAYFGVAPNILWLCVLVFAAFSNGLPKKERWLPAILIAVFVAATAMSAQTLAPEPDARIASFAERILDLFVLDAPPQETEPPPTEPTVMPDIPDIQDDPQTQETMELPEDMELPDILPSKPHSGTLPTIAYPVGPEEKPEKEEGKRLPIAQILLGILLLLAVSVAWWLVVSGKRKKNRAAMYAQDNAEAIRGMYLYAKRWRALNAYAGEIPAEVEEIWLEAAYSDHSMTPAQRDIMGSFVRETAWEAWRNLNWWKRFAVYFCYGL